MNTHRLRKIMTLTVAVAALSATAAFAAGKPPDLVNQTGLAATGAESGYGEVGIGDLSARVIQIIFSLAGIVLMTLNFYAGFVWLTAQGAEEQIKKARAIIRNSMIGLVMIVVSYAVLTAILNALALKDQATISSTPAPAYSTPTGTFQNQPDVTEDLYGSDDPSDPLKGVDF